MIWGIGRWECPEEALYSWEDRRIYVKEVGVLWRGCVNLEGSVEDIGGQGVWSALEGLCIAGRIVR
jgi:hypothetical protein